MTQSASLFYERRGIALSRLWELFLHKRSQTPAADGSSISGPVIKSRLTTFVILTNKRDGQPPGADEKLLPERFVRLALLMAGKKSYSFNPAVVKQRRRKDKCA